MNAPVTFSYTVLLIILALVFALGAVWLAWQFRGSDSAGLQLTAKIICSVLGLMTILGGIATVIRLQYGAEYSSGLMGSQSQYRPSQWVKHYALCGAIILSSLTFTYCLYVIGFKGPKT